MATNDYTALFQEAGKTYNVDPQLLRAVVQVESGGNPNAVSEVGARGAAQLMPATAKSLGVKNAFDPRENIFGAAKLLDENLARYGNANDAILAYHGGTDQRNWGPKTRAYLEKVTSAYQGSGNMPKTINTLGDEPSADRAAYEAFFGGNAAPAQAAPVKVTATTSAPAQDQNRAAYEAFFGNQSAQPVKASAIQQPEKAASQRSAFDETARQFGLTGRAAVTGLTSLPTMAGDALNSLINMGIGGVNRLAGTSIPQLQMPSEVTQRAMNAVGVPQPQNATERAVQDVTSAMAGVSPNVALGNMLARSTAPVARTVGQGMTQLPGMQVTGAAGSALGSTLAQQAGLGPLGQVGAGIVGGIGGAVAPSAGLAAARGVANSGQAIKNVVQPLTNPEAYVGSNLAKQLGPDSAAIAESIRNAREFVPGSLPTTAQAGGTPTLVATEKALSNLSPEFKMALAERGVANNQARWNQLMSVARTPEELAAAVEARAAASTPLYEQAHQQTANVGKAFVDFARRPAVMQAMQEADQLARNEGVKLTWPTPQDRAISGQALDYTSRALSNMIDKATRAGANQEVRALMQAKEYLQGWTERYIPGVKEAATEYAKRSVPVNTMEAGQQIANRLGTGAMGAGGIAELQLNPYRTALANALKGQKYGVEANALERLQGIGQDLQRATISNSLRSPGSDTAYNIAANGWLARQLYGPEFEGAGLGARGLGALGAMVTGQPMAAGAILAGGRRLARQLVIA